MILDRQNSSFYLRLQNNCIYRINSKNNIVDFICLNSSYREWQKSQDFTLVDDIVYEIKKYSLEWKKIEEPEVAFLI